jgi:hypothetical protein
MHPIPYSPLLGLGSGCCRGILHPDRTLCHTLHRHCCVDPGHPLFAQLRQLQASSLPWGPITTTVFQLSTPLNAHWSSPTEPLTCRINRWEMTSRPLSMSLFYMTYSTPQRPGPHPLCHPRQQHHGGCHLPLASWRPAHCSLPFNCTHLPLPLMTDTVSDECW